MRGRAEAEEKQKKKEGGLMGALTSVVLAVVGLVLAWGAVEIACKPCLKSGRDALNRSLNPDYDPDDELDEGTGTYVQAPGKDADDEGGKGITKGSTSSAPKEV